MTWKRYKDEIPVKPNPKGFLIIIEGCTNAALGQFDPTSKRFYTFVATIGKAIQVPVKWWMAIPEEPEED